MPEREERLHGGRTEVHRRGDEVLRAASPWSPTVLTLLRHLEERGFDAAPRVLGTGFDGSGDGRARERLSFVPGEFVHPRSWPEDAMDALGALLRRLHAATAGFEVPPGGGWSDWHGRVLGGPVRVIGHCDFAPWNVVARDGRPAALIDWDTAGPVDPLTELAQVCWLNAQLHDDDVAALAGLAPAAERARHARLICDGYGLARAGRAALVGRMVELAVLDAAEQAIRARVTPDTADAGPLWGLAWRTRAAAWMVRNRAVLDAALV